MGDLIETVFVPAQGILPYTSAQPLAHVSIKVTELPVEA